MKLNELAKAFDMGGLVSCDVNHHMGKWIVTVKRSDGSKVALEPAKSNKPREFSSLAASMNAVRQIGFDSATVRGILDYQIKPEYK